MDHPTDAPGKVSWQIQSSALSFHEPSWYIVSAPYHKPTESTATTPVPREQLLTPKRLRSRIATGPCCCGTPPLWVERECKGVEIAASLRGKERGLSVNADDPRTDAYLRACREKTLAKVTFVTKQDAQESGLPLQTNRSSLFSYSKSAAVTPAAHPAI